MVTLRSKTTSIIFVVVFAASLVDVAVAATATKSASAKNSDSVSVSRSAVRRHVMELLFGGRNRDLRSSELIFSRWERPVRYYVKGLSKKEITLFENEMATIAKYTGLDIKRHESMYLEYKNESRNNRKSWPDGLSTNVVLIFDKNIGALKDDPDIRKIFKGLALDPRIEYRIWKRGEEKIRKGKSFGYWIYRLSGRVGNYFCFVTVDRVFMDARLSSAANGYFLNIVFDIVLPAFRSNVIVPSLSNSGARAKFPRKIPEFDRLLLKVFYDPALHSGVRKGAYVDYITDRIVEGVNRKHE